MVRMVGPRRAVALVSSLLQKSKTCDEPNAFAQNRSAIIATPVDNALRTLRRVSLL